jgi:ATP-binding cassette, subfamily B, bacterial
VLKDAPVLILDEATSSLDSITERAIQDALDREMTGKTVIVVAHRLSTIAHLDRILVFDQGRIVEDGTHAVLLAKRGSYHRLWSMQSDGFLPDGGDHPPQEAAEPPREEGIATGGTLDDGDQSADSRRRDDDSRDSAVLMA